MTTRTRIQVRNSETILDAALDVFSAHGFRGATLDQIAEVAGLSKPNLFFYFTASALGCMFFRELSRGKIRKKKVFWITPVLLMIYGIIIEVVQGSFTSYRSAELLDVLANTLGAVLGTLFILALFSERSQLKWEN